MKITDELVQQACLAYGGDAFPGRMRRALEVALADAQPGLRAPMLELEKLQKLAREAVEIWQAGSAMYSAHEYETAMGDLARALPPKPHAPIESQPGDPF